MPLRRYQGQNVPRRAPTAQQLPERPPHSRQRSTRLGQILERSEPPGDAGWLEGLLGEDAGRDSVGVHAQRPRRAVTDALLRELQRVQAGSQRDPKAAIGVRSDATHNVPCVEDQHPLIRDRPGARADPEHGAAPGLEPHADRPVADRQHETEANDYCSRQPSSATAPRR